MPRRTGGRTRRRALVDGPTPIPIPASFRNHHGQISPFARANLPPRMPVAGSVARLQALADKQLDELCEDVVVMLPLWRIGVPPHAIAAGQPASTASGGSAAASGTSTPTSTMPEVAANLFSTAPQPGAHVQAQTVPVHALLSSPQASSIPTPSPAASVISPSPIPQTTHTGPPHTIPAVSLQTSHVNTTTGPLLSQSSNNSIGTNPNHPDMRPPTEADALALAPHVPIWLPNAHRKRNESRVRLARSFMAGFEGMRALVWDVTLELERRWPLREEEA